MIDAILPHCHTPIFLNLRSLLVSWTRARDSRTYYVDIAYTELIAIIVSCYDAVNYTHIDIHYTSYCISI